MNGKDRRKDYDLEERLLGFAAMVIEIVEALARTPVGRHVGGQLLRSGTSPLGNYAEAQSAESNRDFVHKVRIVLKELRESRAWMRLIQRVGLLRKPAPLAPALDECGQLLAIFHKSVQTAEQNLDVRTAPRQAPGAAGVVGS